LDLNYKLIDTPPNSLKDSNASPKVKTMEEGFGVCSLARNTLKVEGHVKARGWGLGRVTMVNYSHGPAQTKPQVG